MGKKRHSEKSWLPGRNDAIALHFIYERAEASYIRCIAVHDSNINILPFSVEGPCTVDT